ncbi:hypothetical protein M140OLGA_2408 [Staphylococcus aureus subsp. aureus 112808A]|nr:hypothetical protein M140OLGA_2408 [Staphylococcus aureus subsp. aureus 112808A]
MKKKRINNDISERMIYSSSIDKRNLYNLK